MAALSKMTGQFHLQYLKLVGLYKRYTYTQSSVYTTVISTEDMNIRPRKTNYEFYLNHPFV